MLPADSRAKLLLRAVADAGLEPAVLSFSDRDANRYFLVHQHRFLERLDVGKLEQLESVEPALALAQLAPREPIARHE
jgi:hypothetical protein